MAKLVDGFKDGRPELGRRTFLVPENHSEVLALLYHEQTGIVGGLPVGPVTGCGCPTTNSPPSWHPGGITPN